MESDNNNNNSNHEERIQKEEPKISNGIPMWESKRERAHETLQIIESGKYQIIIDQKETEINIKNEIENCIKETKLYDPDDEISISSIQPNSQICDIQVTLESTLQAAKRVLTELGIKEVAALNFASAIKPGGGWLNGREAQEECITRQSSLYLSLTAEQCSEFYSQHEALLDTYTPEAHLYTNYMIYSPSVPVIRDAVSEKLIPPYTISFITSPATNLKKFKEIYKQNKFKEILHEHISEKKKKKEIEQIKKEETNNQIKKVETNENNDSKEEDKNTKEEQNEGTSEEGNNDDITNITPSSDLQYEPFEYSESFGPDYDISDDEYNEIEEETDKCVSDAIKMNYDIMYERCKRILGICILNKNKALILGAFGCGVFGNDPSEISNIFHRLLVEEKYGYYFDVVVFAILGRPSGYSITCFRNKFLSKNSDSDDNDAEDK